MTVAAIVAKLSLFLLAVSQQQMAIITIFINLLIVLVGSFFTVRSFKMKNPGSTMQAEIKNGMKATTFFALLVSLFVLIYYSYIDTHYFADMIQQRVNLAVQEKANHPEIDIDQVRTAGEMMFSPKTHASITLFGLTIVGAIYSFLISLLMRKIPGFK